MSFNLKLQKELLSPPGDTILETIDKIGMSKSELAKSTGFSNEKLGEILVGLEPITLEIAIRLDEALGSPSRFWMARENDYRKELKKVNPYSLFLYCTEYQHGFK